MGMIGLTALDPAARAAPRSVTNPVLTPDKGGIRHGSGAGAGRNAIQPGSS